MKWDPVLSRIAFIDFEATGPNPSEDRPTEVACLITDNDFNILDKYQSFIWEKTYPELSLEIEQLTNIKNAHLIAGGKHPSKVFKELDIFCSEHSVKWAVAHNSQFDKTIWESECVRQSMDPPCIVDWICTLKDVPYDSKFRCKILSHLALDHGISIDPSTLHRAMADVELLVKLMREGGYSLPEILAFKSQPWVYIKVEVPPPWEDNGKGKEIVRAAGYSWQKDMRWGDDAPSFSKQWVKRVKAGDLETEKLKDLGYPRRVVQGVI